MNEHQSMERGDAVLLVDDDATSRLLAERALVSAGFVVLCAGNGRMAIELFDEHDPDLVIMDADLPVTDGFEALAAIRSRAEGTHVPILMIMDPDDHDAITRAYHEGASDFLIRPVDIHVLPHRLRYLLRARQAADALRASQMSLDRAQRIARLGNWEWDTVSGQLEGSVEFDRLFEEGGLAPPRNWQALIGCIDSDEREAVASQAESAVASGSPLAIELKLDPGSGDGHVLFLAAEPRLDENGDCVGMLGTLQDITERVVTQQRIHDLAYTDVVTGLANRARLQSELDATLERARRNHDTFALLFLDLDHFKQVNDTLGHDAGDELLCQVAGRLCCVVREASDDAERRTRSEREGTDTIARLGGDEFVVLLGQIDQHEDAARVAERIAATIAEPYRLADTEVCVTTTIGISVFPADGKDAETLMKHADIAMYEAKQRGRNGFQFYSRRIHEAAIRRFEMEADLRDAIENNALTLVYLPKLDLASGRVSGAEALLRWRHPQHGDVSPTVFVRIAEESGLIVPLGRWVMVQACRQMQSWVEAGVAIDSVAVNCSAVQFVRGDMLSDIHEALAASGLDPTRLEIELNESLLMQDIELGIQALGKVRALGAQVAIDDFGTGFSSLAYIKRLPVDKLKIDRSFIDDLDSDKADRAIVQSIILLCHELGIKVVAEGVEHQTQRTLLERYGCDEIQGYLLSRPVTADELIAWIDTVQAGMKKAS